MTIFFIIATVAISIMFYRLGRKNGYTDGASVGYDYGWVDGIYRGRNSIKRK